MQKWAILHVTSLSFCLSSSNFFLRLSASLVRDSTVSIGQSLPSVSDIEDFPATPALLCGMGDFGENL